MKTRALFAAFSLVTVMTLVFSLVSCGTEIDKDGIFKDIEKEIELKEATAKGNIFDIVLGPDSRLYAGGGKVYAKANPGNPGDWYTFSGSPLSGGLVVRLAITGNTMTVECGKGGNRGYYYKRTWNGTSWTGWNSGSAADIATYDTAHPEAHYNDETVGGIANVTCRTIGTPYYYGTTNGIKAASGTVPGSNADAAIGSHRISAIYASGSAIYVATIGTGTVNATKKNGLWAYYGSTWNRE